MPPTDDELLDLAERVGAACRARGMTIATAESCTAGLVAHLLTEIPGSSDYFRGGLVTYANDVKTALAGVPDETLAAHGAVSAQVAVAMAEGVRHRLGVDVAVAVTGVAGPGGGTPSKPVGLTYVAVADGTGDDVRRFRMVGGSLGQQAVERGRRARLLAERLSGGAA